MPYPSAGGERALRVAGRKAPRGEPAAAGREGGCERKTPGCGRVTRGWEAKLERMSTDLAVCNTTARTRDRRHRGYLPRSTDPRARR